MDDLTKYLNDILDVKTSIVPLRKTMLQQLPFYITSSYKVWETTVYERRICLLVAENGDDIPPPDQLYKQMFFIAQKLGMPVVYVFTHVVSYNLKRMIRKRINFIIPGKQLFIPTLMMDLRSNSERQPFHAVSLTPLAQFLLLFHLQKEGLNDYTTQQLTDKFIQPYRTVNRAVKNLEELELCNLVGGKEKRLQFTTNGKDLWLLAQDYLQNPVERTFFTDETLNDQPLCLSNINAMAYYTMLNDEAKYYYAVNKETAKNLTVETNKYMGDNTIEVWRYNPYPLSENGFVDKLSLYLLLKNDTDERIQVELEQMINDIHRKN